MQGGDLMLITNIGRLITMEPRDASVFGGLARGRSSRGSEGPLGVVKNACVEIEDEKIRVIASAARSSGVNNCASPSSAVRNDTQVIDAQGGVVIPGLIDCHTHLVHAGTRADEFAARARGARYEEIAKAGGGIMSTVRATRAASEDRLLAVSRERANEALSHGVTTIEVKSGYGLDVEAEIKMLRVVRQLSERHPMEFVPTFLGAHTIPIEYLTRGKEGRKEYIRLIIDEMMPYISKEGLAKFCDVFVEKIAFTKEEGALVLKAAKKHGFQLKVHADQLSSSGGSLLAAELKAVSADHLEYLSMRGLIALKKAKVTPVLIPTSTFFVGGKYAAGKTMIKEGLSPAISTDYNPGTSPVLNIWMAASVAITQMKITAEDAYKGITINAARALSMEKSHGSISRGKAADLVVLDCKSEFEPLYRFDRSYVSKVMKRGKVVYG